VPLIERVNETLQRKALLFVGDCKMAALHTRAYVAQCEQFYLMPLPATGETQDSLPQWIAEGPRPTRGQAVDGGLRQR
jgi:transposase